jgi:hypothetical protein
MIKLTALLVLTAAVVGFVLIKYISFRLKIKRRTKSKELLLAYGNVIEVPFSDCDIKSGQLHLDKEFSSMPSRTEMIDALFGKHNEQPAPSTAAYIIYTRLDNAGTSHRFISSPIFMSSESLRLRLDKQHHTKIYVDPRNIGNYFFDVSFLDDIIL